MKSCSFHPTYRSWFGRFLLVTLVTLSSTAWAQSIPPVPPDARFLSDYAQTLSARARTEIGRIQQETFARDHVPIIVVTIANMARYGWTDKIEPFATHWFDAWGIGSRADNCGMLLLVSIGDHKARIELGASWGRRWDDYCAQIMRDQIVPRFKDKDFDSGIIAGVEALAKLATCDPQGEVPKQNLWQAAHTAIQTNRRVSPASPWGAKWIALMALLGASCLVLAIPLTGCRRWLLKVGLGLLIGSALGWILIAYMVATSAGKSNGDGDGGFFGDSGGFGGGDSGGGGASGDW